MRGVFVEVRVQLPGVGSLHTPSGIWTSNSSCRIWPLGPYLNFDLRKKRENSKFTNT